MNTPGDVKIRITDLKKYFPVARTFAGKSGKQIAAVDGVDLEVEKGRTLGIVGESGCGKTTLGRAMVRLIEPTGGTIEYEYGGTILQLVQLTKRELRIARRDMNMIYQDPYSSLNPRMNIRNIIAEPIVLHKEARGKQLNDRIAVLLESVRLKPHVMNRFPHSFSGGQRQRIAIARALALSPSFIVCDEPTSALDVSIQSQILNLLMELQKTHGLTYLFISHDLGVVRHVSDHVAVMYLGKIVEFGRALEVCASPQHPYTEALLSAIPIPDPNISRTRPSLKGGVGEAGAELAGCRFNTRCLYREDICTQREPKLNPSSLGQDHLSACHMAEHLALFGISDTGRVSRPEVIN